MVDPRCSIPVRLSRTLLIALLLAMVGFLLQPTISVYAGTLTVTTTIDELASPGTGCSLREAIMEANAAVPGTYPECGVATGGGADTINLPAGTYTLTLGQELLVNSEITLSGAGAATTIIEAATAPGVATWRVLHNDGGDVTINDVTIRHGRCNGACIHTTLVGGGIYNQSGNLTLNASTVTANQAEGVTGHAGGIFNRAGTLTLDASVVSGNSAFAYGGGIWNWDLLIVQNGSVIGGAGAANTAGAGGAIGNVNGTTIIDASTLSANQAVNGGAIYIWSGTLTIQNGSVIGGAGAGNTASLSGGGIFNEGATITINASTVSDNQAAQYGGGIYNWPGAEIGAIRDSIFSGNQTTDDNGHGGGINNRGRILLIENSRFTNNRTATSGGSGDGGAIYNDGYMERIARVTFDANRANGASGDGGAIFTDDRGLFSDFDIYHSTFSANTAGQSGGAIANIARIETLVYNAFIGNTASAGSQGVNNTDTITTFTDNYFDNAGQNCNGTPVGARNFDNDGTCGADIGVALGTHYNGTLADNGCVTPLADGTCVPTHALIPGSALENPTGGVNCGVTDERGFSRDVICDTGPFELPPPDIDVQRPAGTSIADGGADNLGTQVIGEQTLIYTIDNTAGSGDLVIPAGGVTATNLTNVSNFAVTTGLPLTIPAGGITTLQISYRIDAIGAFSFDLDIENNDIDENPYDIHVQGTGTINLVTSTACNGDDLVVDITAGDANFNISADDPASVTQAQNNVPTGIYTLTASSGGGIWTNIVVSELNLDNETVNLGDRQCPPAAPPPGGGGSASSCNLVIDVEADHEVVAPGDRVVWTVLVTNSGSAECQSVQTYGTMPGEFAINGITPSRGNLNWDGGPYYRVELGTLAVNEQVTVNIDSLLQGIAAITLPEGAAGQSAGTQICLTGYITDPVNDTDCVTLFPDILPSTGGEPVNESLCWVWVAAGLLIIGTVGFALRLHSSNSQTQEKLS